jgi:hypothetical protein
MSALQSVALMRQVRITVVRKQKKCFYLAHQWGHMQLLKTPRELMVIRGFFICVLFHIFKKCGFSDFPTMISMRIKYQEQQY